MAEFKEISPNAPAGEKLMNWVDNRFPATSLFKAHMSEYYASKNLNIWYVFGALSLLACHSNRHRHFLGDALQTRCQSRLCLC